MTWTTGWGSSLIAPGATLSAAGLAGLVASRSVIRWSEQRQRDGEAAEYRQREDVYGQIVVQMTAVFSGGVDIELDSKVRATAALWADPETLEALARWREAIGPVTKRGGEVGDLKEPILTAYYEVVVAMRTELGGTAKSRQPSREFLLASIFDDRPALSTPIADPETA